jgi:cytosine deaminase
MIPNAAYYWLRNAHISKALLVRSSQEHSPDWLIPENALERDELLTVDIEIAEGKIASIATADPASEYSHPAIDLRGGMVFPCFADLHTHLDKGHLWERSPNPDGTFASALATVAQDSAQNYTETDVYRRMEFGLKCSYAHGTQAIRTHIDAAGRLADLSLGVFQQLREQWRDRLTLQAVNLVSLD